MILLYHIFYFTAKNLLRNEVVLITTILKPQQITAALGSATIAQACAVLGQISEVEFRIGLIDLGIPETAVNELILCMLKAGTVFAV